MRPSSPPGVHIPGTLQMPAGHVHGYLDAFRDLMATIYEAVDGTPAPAHPTFEDGARGVRVLDALVRSADTQAWTTVSP
jgi:predicted dehydrogenase